MSKANREIVHRRLRRLWHVKLEKVRRRWWDADAVAAELNGWTLTRRPFGVVTVRDPRFDQLRVDGSMSTGRWS